MTTQSFAESFEVFNEILADFGQPPISENTARHDFSIRGGETIKQLDEWARDYVSECATDTAAANQEWRYVN